MSLHHCTSVSDPSSNQSTESNTAVKKIRNTNYKCCGVCGTIAKCCFNHGGLSCSSCKSFFRRSVANDNYLRYSCISLKSRCTISVSNRINCKSCRMARCFANGMVKDWLPPNSKRHTTYIPKRNAHYSKDKVFLTDFHSGTQFQRLTSEFLSLPEMQATINQFYKDCSKMEVDLNLSSEKNLFIVIGILKQVFEKTTMRFRCLHQLLPELSNLPYQDQTTLLKNGILEISILRLTLVLLDPVKKCCPNIRLMRDQRMFQLSDDGVSSSKTSVAAQMLVDFIDSLHQIGIDEATVMLMTLIVLFTPERSCLVRRRGVEKCQNRFALLLERYIVWRYDGFKSKLMYAKLLMKLVDLRELSELEDFQPLRLESDRLLSNVDHFQFPNKSTAKPSAEFCETAVDEIIHHSTHMELSLPGSKSLSICQQLCAAEEIRSPQDEAANLSIMDQVDTVANSDTDGLDTQFDATNGMELLSTNETEMGLSSNLVPPGNDTHTLKCNNNCGLDIVSSTVSIPDKNIVDDLFQQLEKYLELCV